MVFNRYIPAFSIYFRGELLCRKTPYLPTESQYDLIAVVSVLSLQMTGSNEYKLNQGPEDSISAVKFSPSTGQFLLVSSWDCTVRLYDVGGNSMRIKYSHLAPVLDCAFYVNKFSFFVVGHKHSIVINYSIFKCRVVYFAAVTHTKKKKKHDNIVKVHFYK